MKSIFTLFISALIATQVFGQGSIQSISVSPANPTVSDDIEIHVDLMFTSSDCQPDNQGHSVNGNTIGAYALHCVGMLTAICNTTDVFQIGQLPAGNYTFDFTLSSGFGGPNCSPGIVPDDNDQLQFTVSPTVGVNEISLDPNFAFPNPVSDILFLHNSLKESAIILDVRGSVIMEIESGKKQIDLHDLQAGIYLLRTESKQFRFVKN